MRLWVHALLVAAAAGAATSAAACGKSGGARLEGHWRGVFIEGVPPEAQQAAMQFAKSMEIDVRGDAITVTAGPDKQSGHFVIDSEDARQLVIHTDRDGANDKQTFTFSGESAMKWAVADSRTTLITFVRE